MARLVYRDWILSCDVDATREAYEGIDFGGAEACDCYLCRNFLLTRPRVFSAEILDLFAKLGIDHRKEAESYHIAPIANGLHLYGAWFHFVGQIVQQPDSPTKLSEHSTIDFFAKRDLAAESFANKPLVQVELTLTVSWLLDEEEPDQN
ncbi:MAG: hypothetical protein AB7Q37_08565 [Pyrinomonadaceae bacterium]